ncbi:MAG: RNA polymerase sigma factor [Saprospiraceae bacterium]
MLQFFRSDTPSQWTDEALLERYQTSGEAQYLGLLYERYMPMVYGVCLKILRDPGKSEDAVMNIYEELVRKAREHQVESFRGWLFVLARNHCLMEWRKNQRRPTDYHAPENMVHYDAVEAAFEVELPVSEDKSLEKCLEQLPQHQRTSVTMFYYEEKTYKEIATLLAEEVGKVRSYIQNGRRNLKICLENTSSRHET